MNKKDVDFSCDLSGFNLFSCGRYDILIHGPGPAEPAVKGGSEVRATEVSILFPVRDIEEKIPEILRFEAEQAKEIGAEVVVVDMGSTDRTVLRAVQAIKELGLPGFVVQNGRSQVPAALNTAVRRAGGEYLTFLFARRVYGGFLKPYLDAARRAGADFVYGCKEKEEIPAAGRRAVSSVVRRPDGGTLVRGMLAGGAVPDIAAVLVRREFLAAQELFLAEDCAFGYAEEFILRCLLCAGAAVQAPVVPERHRACEMRRGKQSPVGKAVFQRVPAMLRVLETAKSRCGGDAELLRLLQRERLPAAVMSAVNVALREGADYRKVKEYLSETGFDRLLTVDRRTNAALRRRVRLWKTLPRLYRPYGDSQP